MDTGNFPSGSAESIPPESTPQPQSEGFSSPSAEPVSAPGQAQRPQNQQPGKNRNRRRSRRGRHAQGRPQQQNQRGPSHQNRNSRSGGARQAFSGPMDHSYRQNGEANGNSVQPGNNPHNGRTGKQQFGRGGGGGGRFRRFGRRQAGQNPNLQPGSGFVPQHASPELQPLTH